MKLKLKQIWECGEAISGLLKKELSNIKASYWIGRNAKRIESEFKVLNEKRITLVKQFGTENKKTKNYDIPDDKLEEFNTKFKELLNIEVEVDIKTVLIDDIKDAKISPRDISVLDFMLVLDREAEKAKKEKAPI